MLIYAVVDGSCRLLLWVSWVVIMGVALSKFVRIMNAFLIYTIAWFAMALRVVVLMEGCLTVEKRIRQATRVNVHVVFVSGSCVSPQAIMESEQDSAFASKSTDQRPPYD
jgi:hypothetical protein